MRIPELKNSQLQKLGLGYHTVKAHPAIGYLRIFEALLADFGGKEMTLMELGAGPIKTIGASFYMWRDFFPLASIVGVDNKSEASTIEDLDGRIKIEIGDLGEEAFLSYLAMSYRPDIIVDDASHLWAHQIRSFEVLFSSLVPGGIYIVEDLHTSFGPLRKAYGGTGDDAASYFSKLAILLCGRNEDHPLLADAELTSAQYDLLREIEYVSFLPRLVVIQKTVKPRPGAFASTLQHEKA